MNNIMMMILKFIDGSAPNLLQSIWGAPEQKIIDLARKLVTGGGSPGGEEITLDERGYLLQIATTLYIEAKQLATLANTGVLGGFHTDDYLARCIQWGALAMFRLGGKSDADDGLYPSFALPPNADEAPLPSYAIKPTVATKAGK